MKELVRCEWSKLKEFHICMMLTIMIVPTVLMISAYTMEESVYNYHGGWENFFVMFVNAMLCLIPITIIFTLVYYTRDYEYRIEEIVYASKYGKNNYMKVKMGITYGVSIIIIIMIAIILFISNSYWFGFSDGSGSIQLGSREFFSSVPYVISWKQLILIAIVLGIFGNLAIASITMLITSFLKKSYQSLLASSFVFAFLFLFSGNIGAHLSNNLEILKKIRIIVTLLPLYSMQWNRILTYKHESLIMPSYIMAYLLATFVVTICSWICYKRYGKSCVRS
jgi:hypothetical protein